MEKTINWYKINNQFDGQKENICKYCDKEISDNSFKQLKHLRDTHNINVEYL